MQKHGMLLSRIRGLAILTGAGVTLVAAPASADVELAPLVVIDLSTYDGSGFDPEPAAGQLDSDDWSIRLSPENVLDFGGTAGGAGSDFARGLSTGGVDDPAIWAFDVDGAGLIALGVQPTDLAFTPGQAVLRLVNNTGAEITEFQVEYTVWINNDVGRSNSINLEHSADDVTYVQVGDGLNSPEPADRNGFTANDEIEVVMPDAPIADGGQYYIAWSGDDVSGAGPARDEFGLEGITIRLLNTCGNGLVENEEACDDGLGNSDTGSCLTTCEAAACGDGFVQDGVEECDDGNVDAGDGCAADCTEEVAADSSGTDGGTAVDDTGATSGSASDSDSADASASATMTDATATNATSPGDESGSEGDDDGGEDDDEVSCACRSSEAPAPIWGMLGLGVLALVRRRR
jgi:MYXO-CTERM domain-containing protein